MFSTYRYRYIDQGSDPEPGYLAGAGAVTLARLHHICLIIHANDMELDLIRFLL